MGAEMVSVYIPQAYHWAGQLYVLPRNKVRKMEKISSGDAMKYAVTGGVVDADAERKQNKDTRTTDAVEVRQAEPLIIRMKVYYSHHEKDILYIHFFFAFPDTVFAGDFMLIKKSTTMLFFYCRRK